MVIQIVLFLLKLVTLETRIKISNPLCLLLSQVCEGKKLVLLAPIATSAKLFDMLPSKKFFNLILLFLWIKSYKSQHCSTGTHENCCLFFST